MAHRTRQPDRSCALAGLLLAVLTTSVSAAGDIRTERVHFKPGASSATVEASITGYEIVDYVLGARKGQAMTVSMATKHTATYFNILAPGETEVAMFNGSIDENRYEGALPESGDYRIRVYMMRSAARRNEKASYRLAMRISDAPDAGRPSVVTNDAKVPGTPYHATGTVPCSMAEGQPKASCPFGVIREGSGNGSVTVTKPDGRTRVIFFERGRPTGCDASEADPGEFRASRDRDSNLVRIGGESYEIPDAVIEGG